MPHVAGVFYVMNSDPEGKLICTLLICYKTSLNVDFRFTNEGSQSSETLWSCYIKHSMSIMGMSVILLYQLNFFKDQ